MKVVRFISLNMSSLLPHSLSSGCKSALQQLSADADAKACFDPAPLVSMITDPNFVNISIIDQGGTGIQKIYQGWFKILRP